MASRPEHHGHLTFGKEIERAHHVVAGGDLMVDVLDTRPVRRKQRDRVMDLVDTQQRRISDPVADPRVAHLGPEGLVTHCVGGAQPDVAETGDPGVALAVIAPAAGGWPPYQLDLVACRVVEGDELAHPTQFGLLNRTQADMMTEPIKLASRRLQIRAPGHFERGGLVGRRTGEIT